jgi:HSP20 family molecular chaperone IbpA
MAMNPEVDRGVRVPAVDIYEREKDMLLVADLPGVSEDDLDIRVERNRLTIHAPVPSPPPGVRVHKDEMGEGDFTREFAISEDLDASRVEAEFDNGVLRLAIPRSKERMPMKIEIRKP